MGTPVQKVYDAFLAKILSDEWDTWTTEEQNQDFEQILDGAIPNFKFPRVPLERNETNQEFLADLSNEEIQILACYMKCEWLSRTILTWENLKPLYEERDFSQANLLSKFNEKLEKEQKTAEKRESKYYRVINYKPFCYRQLGGQTHE